MILGNEGLLVAGIIMLVVGLIIKYAIEAKPRAIDVIGTILLWLGVILIVIWAILLIVAAI